MNRAQWGAGNVTHIHQRAGQRISQYRFEFSHLAPHSLQHPPFPILVSVGRPVGYSASFLLVIWAFKLLHKGLLVHIPR